jgi:hypothetical protein
MEALIIKEDPEEASTPGVILDKENNKFEIWGNSLPENIAAFYKPIFNWIEEYKKQPNPKTKLFFNPVYFNSSSFKAILDILLMLEELIPQGYEVEIEWKYLETDEDVSVTGKELQGLAKNINFTFSPYYE